MGLGISMCQYNSKYANQLWLPLQYLALSTTDIVQFYHKRTPIAVSDNDATCNLESNAHDDVIKWKHFLRYWPFVRSPVNSPLKGQWRGALMFSLICTWINSWINNHEAGDLRRHCGHCDVAVMKNSVVGQEKSIQSIPMNDHANIYHPICKYKIMWRPYGIDCVRCQRKICRNYNVLSRDEFTLFILILYRFYRLCNDVMEIYIRSHWKQFRILTWITWI